LRRELLDGAWNRIYRDASAETRGPSFAMRRQRFVTPRGSRRFRCGFTSFARDAPLANVRLRNMCPPAFLWLGGWTVSEAASRRERPDQNSFTVREGSNNWTTSNAEHAKL